VDSLSGEADELTAAYSALIAAALVLIPSVPVRALDGSFLSYIPLDHWSYRVFDRLASLGLVPLHAISARPITRLEAQRLVQEASRRIRGASPAVVRLAQEDLRRLAVEFATSPTLEISVGGLHDGRSTDFIPHRLFGTSSISLGFAAGADAWIYGRALGGGRSGNPPGDEYYGSFQLGSVLVQLGRGDFSSGPGLRSSVQISDNAGTIPLFRLTAELPQARLTKAVMLLERTGGSPPGEVALFATRLDWLVTPRFRLGFEESVVTAWGGPLTLYHLLEPIPVLSAIIAPYDFHEILGQARNISVAVDFDWLPQPGIRLYGAGFIDDAADRIAERRARVGLLAGIYLVDLWGTGRTSLRLEYSGVTNGTYSYSAGLEHAYRGRSLGHWLGPDGDDLYLELTHRVSADTRLQLSFAYTRHGEGRIGQPSPPPEDWFLSGVVEHRRTLGLQLQRIHSPSLETRYRAEIVSVTNQGNVAGVNGWEWLLGLEMTYRWPAASPEVDLSEEVEPAEPAPAQEGRGAIKRAPNRLAVRHWSAAMTSSGALSGPAENASLTGLVYRANISDFAASFSYDAGDEQAFWSVDLHYPLAQFEHGGISVFAGWGGLRRHGMLGGVVRDLNLSGPRLGADFIYQFAPGGVGTPLYLSGELSSPLLRGIWAPLEGGAPFYYWTYNLGVGWQFRDGLRFEVGYRGAAAVWRADTPDMTTLYWDGLYAAVTLK